MDEERLTLLLLPRMDETGDLFAGFVRLLPDWIEPRVVNHPCDQEPMDPVDDCPMASRP